MIITRGHRRHGGARGRCDTAVDQELRLLRRSPSPSSRRTNVYVTVSAAWSPAQEADGRRPDNPAAARRRHRRHGLALHRRGRHPVRRGIASSSVTTCATAPSSMSGPRGRADVHRRLGARTVAARLRLRRRRPPLRGRPRRRRAALASSASDARFDGGAGAQGRGHGPRQRHAGRLRRSPVAPGTATRRPATRSSSRAPTATSAPTTCCVSLAKAPGAARSGSSSRWMPTASASCSSTSPASSQASAGPRASTATGTYYRISFDGIELVQPVRLARARLATNTDAGRPDDGRHLLRPRHDAHLGRRRRRLPVPEPPRGPLRTDVRGVRRRDADVVTITSGTDTVIVRCFDTDCLSPRRDRRLHASASPSSRPRQHVTIALLPDGLVDVVSVDGVADHPRRLPGHRRRHPDPRLPRQPVASRATGSRRANGSDLGSFVDEGFAVGQRLTHLRMRRHHLHSHGRRPGRQVVRRDVPASPVAPRRPGRRSTASTSCVASGDWTGQRDHRVRRRRVARSCARMPRAGSPTASSRASGSSLQQGATARSAPRSRSSAATTPARTRSSSSAAAIDDLAGARRRRVMQGRRASPPSSRSPTADWFVEQKIVLDADVGVQPADPAPGRQDLPGIARTCSRSCAARWPSRAASPAPTARSSSGSSCRASRTARCSRSAASRRRPSRSTSSTSSTTRARRTAAAR